MKKTLFIITASVLSLSLLAGCASTQPEPVPAEPIIEPAPEPEIQEPEPVAEEIPEIPAEEPAPEPEAPVDEEYLRSVNQLSVTLEEFNEDKSQILQIISELDSIMKKKDYSSWVKYLDPESIEYWSRPANLQKAAARLPVRGLKLNSLEDYFSYIFISSRVGKRVDEIRYETETTVKAVQVNDQNDTVYYNFQKIDGQWKLHLPPLTD